jgi:hypothetical protein
MRQDLLIWLIVGEIVYLLCSSITRLQHTFVNRLRDGTPHPRVVMIVSMVVCLLFWPLFVAAIGYGAFLGICSGFRNAK